MSDRGSVEEWRPVVGYEGIYEVSSIGRVRSIDRIVPLRTGGVTFRKGRVLKTRKNPSGHVEVKLSRECRPKTKLVHQLVCIAFHGPRPDGEEVRHLNDTPDDNRRENPVWGTRVENIADRRINGISYQMNKTHCPRNHPLAGSNLCPWQLLKDRRECLACSRASSRVSYYKRKKGILLDMQTESDNEFSKICHTERTSV